MSKIGILSFLISVIFVTGIYPQSDEENSLENDFPPIILERDWWHYWLGSPFNQYQLLDGTLLNHKRVRSIISTVPENEKLLREQRAWIITNNISGILCIGSFTAWMWVWNNDILPNAEIMAPVFLSSGIVTAALMIISDDVWKHKFRRAINNYNLYIQGIPIM
jgi:hypothetical protein